MSWTERTSFSATHQSFDLALAADGVPSPAAATSIRSGCSTLRRRNATSGMSPVATRAMVPGSGVTLIVGTQVTDPLFEPEVAPGSTPADGLQFNPGGAPSSLRAICAPANAVCAWAKVPIELPKMNAKVSEVPSVSELRTPFVVIAPNWFSNNPNPPNPLTFGSYCQPVTAPMLAGSATVTFPIAILVIALLVLLAGAFCEVLVTNNDKWVASMYVAVQDPQNRNVLPEQPDPVNSVCESATLGSFREWSRLLRTR